MSVTIQVPTREQASEKNQAFFDQFKKNIGFMPNLYATYTYSETALADYLQLQNRKTSLRAKEKEIVNLVVSQVNACAYCLAAHTALAKMQGFTEAETIEIRKAEISFDDKFQALAAFAKDMVLHRGKPSESTFQQLFNAGYSKENLIDIILLIGDKTISNFLHGATQIPVDFPEAPAL